MAHNMKQQVRTIVGIPVTVEYRALPSKWELKPHPGIQVSSPDGPPAHPMRFFESPEFEVRTDQKSPIPEPIDPWKMRESFLDLKTEQDFLTFLNEFGSFSVWSSASRRWDVEDFRGWQRLFRDFMRRSPAMWDKVLRPKMAGSLADSIRQLSRSFHLSFRWKDKQQPDWRSASHLAVIGATNVVTAILATIYVDHLHGIKFGFCARPDCRRAFEITSKHKRKFCDQYCAHLQSQRQMRASQRREGKKQKHPNRHVILREA